MKDIIKQLYDKFIGSLDNSMNGFSSRKLTAFVLIAVVIAIHIKWLALGDFSNLEMVLTIDYAFIASLFGMTTYQSMKSQPKSSSSTTEEQVGGDSSKTTITNEQVGGEITNPPTNDKTS